MTPQIDVREISAMLSAGQILHVFASKQQMLDFTAQVLKRIPGVSSCRICIRGDNHAYGDLVSRECAGCLAPADSENKEIPECVLGDRKNYRIYSLRSVSGFYGLSVVLLNDPNRYESYDPFVRNFVNVVVVNMENRLQQEALKKHNRELQQHRDQLELLMQQRTSELEKRERLLESTQEISRTGGWEYDVESGSVFWTNQVYDIHGFETKEPYHASSTLVEQSIACYEPEDRQIIRKAFEDCVREGKTYDLELRFTPRNRNTIWIRTRAKPVVADGTIIKVIGDITDINDTKQYEEGIKSALKEKETLLREIHHRVKNNMAVVSSLLALHGSTSKNAEVKKALKESQARIFAMLAVHEALYRSENLSEINLIAYLNKLTASLVQTYSVNPDNVRVIVDGDAVKVGIDKASPLALVVNELIANALKYAFPNNRNGIIKATTGIQNDQLAVIIEDDGVGLPDGFDWQNGDSLGLKLVRSLVENQLDGSIEMDNRNGTHFRILIHLDK